VSCLAVSPDGNYLISGSYDTNVKLWELSNGECIYTYTNHTDAVNAVAFHPDGTRFISGSSDKTIQVWEIRPEIFVEHYYAKNIEDELSQSDLFKPKAKEEPKADYKVRQEKADAYRNELIQKYYNKYLSEIKGKVKK
jgi:WD40 repeat protein